MIGLFLPRQRVVSLLKLQRTFSVAGPERPLWLSHAFRNGSIALRNNQQDGGGNVSAPV